MLSLVGGQAKQCQLPKRSCAWQSPVGSGPSWQPDWTQRSNAWWPKLLSCEPNLSWQQGCWSVWIIENQNLTHKNVHAVACKTKRLYISATKKPVARGLPFGRAKSKNIVTCSSIISTVGRSPKWEITGAITSQLSRTFRLLMPLPSMTAIFPYAALATNVSLHIHSLTILPIPAKGATTNTAV